MKTGDTVILKTDIFNGKVRKGIPKIGSGKVTEVCKGKRTGIVVVAFKDESAHILASNLMVVKK